MSTPNLLHDPELPGMLYKQVGHRLLRQDSYGDWVISTREPKSLRKYDPAADEAVRKEKARQKMHDAEMTEKIEAKHILTRMNKEVRTRKSSGAIKYKIRAALLSSGEYLEYQSISSAWEHIKIKTVCRSVFQRRFVSADSFVVQGVKFEKLLLE